MIPFTGFNYYDQSFIDIYFFFCLAIYGVIFIQIMIKSAFNTYKNYAHLQTRNCIQKIIRRNFHWNIEAIGILHALRVVYFLNRLIIKQGQIHLEF